MANEAFGYALDDINLVHRAVGALRMIASNTAASQKAIQLYNFWKRCYAVRNVSHSHMRVRIL